MAAWTRGDDRGAAALTTDPRAAGAALAANRRGLDGARVDASVTSVDEQGDSARATVLMRWDVPAIGAWTYRTRVALQRRDGHWKVLWRPTVVHPRLTATRRLGTVRDPAVRAPILDRQRRTLVSSRAVMRVGIDRATVSDIDATATALAGVLDVDGAALARAARRAGPKQFVEAVTLRASDYAPLAQRVQAIQGVQVVQGTAQLAPSRSFARALLGGVGPATAEQIKRSNGKVAVGDDIGQWGLEARYQDQLAGTPARRIVIRDHSGAPIVTLLRRPSSKGVELDTTLDRDVQQAAEEALGDSKAKSALVAVQPSTGDILAVANRPTDATYDRAIDGRYPPGSTFKVITTTALLRAGLKTSDTVNCPKTITVDGKLFKNFEGGAAGAVPFATDFAQSCNTAFVSLAPRLAPDALPRTARDFGLGRTSASQVPAGRDAVARAATMIGQDRIVASPLAMAGVAATVADGRWHAPRLVDSDRRRTGTALSDSERATLHDAHAQRGDLRAPARRSPRCPATSRARAAPPSTAAATRPPRTRGSSPSAATSPSPSSSRTAARAGRSRRRSPSASSTRWGREGELSSAAPRGAALREKHHRGKAPRRRPGPWRVPARGGAARRPNVGPAPS